jgi:hypothetical protein
MKIQTIGYKEDGKPYQMPNERIFQRELDNLPPGKYQHTVEKYKRVATHRQFGYLYAVVLPLSLIALNNAGYEFVDVNEVDTWWKLMFANKKVVDRVTGEIVVLPQSKSEFMTTDEMVYTDLIRNYCSEYLNTNIPDPTKDWKRQKEISRRKNGDFQI